MICTDTNTPKNACETTVCHTSITASLVPRQIQRVYGDQAYRGRADVIRQRAPRAKDFTNQRYRYNGQIDRSGCVQKVPDTNCI